MTRKRKKKVQQPSSGTAKLKRELSKTGMVVKTAEPAPGEQKLSAALIALVSPFTPYARTLPEYRTLISMGVTAWNLPLLKGPEREVFYKQVIQPFLESGDEQMRREAREIFDTLLKRRERDFPEDKRFIVNYTVTADGDDYNVAVATVGPASAKANELP